MALGRNQRPLNEFETSPVVELSTEILGNADFLMSYEAELRILMGLPPAPTMLFDAGLAWPLVEGSPLVETVRFANCARRLACVKLGVIPGLVRYEAIKSAFIDNYG